MRRIWEQITFSGGSYTYLLSVPFLLDASQLSKFFVLFSIAQITHAFIILYIYNPILSGASITSQNVLKRVAVAVVIGNLYLYISANFFKIDIMFDFSTSATVTGFSMALLFYDLQRLKMNQSETTVSLATTLHFVRWTSALALTALYPDKAILVLTIVPLLLSTLPAFTVKAKSQDRSIQGHEQSDGLFAASHFYFNAALSACINSMNPEFIVAFYTIRNLLNFTNTFVQFLEVHVFRKYDIKYFRQRINFYNLLNVLVFGFLFLFIISTIYLEINRDLTMTYVFLLAVIALNIFQPLYRIMVYLVRRQQGYSKFLIARTVLAASILSIIPVFKSISDMNLILLCASLYAFLFLALLKEFSHHDNL